MIGSDRKRDRAEQLLCAMLPAPAAAELSATGRIAARRHEDVAVLFCDIVGFTGYCETHPPEAVVDNLDRLVDASERIVAANGLEKIKTIGDGVMVAANLLMPHGDPVMAGIRCAAAMARAAAANPARWRLRAGIHVGPVVAGAVGRSNLGFDLWGDTVNVAARLSELGPAGAIHLSGQAFARVAGRCRGEPLGRVPLKGRGRIDVFRCADAP